jgi:hypothetical protein
VIFIAGWHRPARMQRLGVRQQSCRRGPHTKVLTPGAVFRPSGSEGGKHFALPAPIQGEHRPLSIRLSRCNFRKTQGEERLAGGTEICRLWRVDDGKHSGFAAACARGGGIRSLGVGRHRERILQFTHLGGFEFESRIAMVADMVEAARRLAGVKDILGSALRAGNGNGRKPHRPSE